MKEPNTAALVNHLFFDDQDIRSTFEGGKPIFAGTDVAKILGYSKPANAVTDHCKGVTVLMTPSKGGRQPTKFIGEADVYRLVLKSKAPHAEKFQDWICEEVLPALRRDGFYVSPNATPIQREILSQRFKLAALEKQFEMLQLEDRAKRVMEVPGAVPISDWVDKHCPIEEKTVRANIVRAIKRHIQNTLGAPVGVARKHGNKLVAANPDNIARAVLGLSLTRADIADNLRIESGTATVKTEALARFSAENNPGSEIAN
ncbi:MAG: BRO family protein [Verrucomicrobiota bacterium]